MSPCGRLLQIIMVLSALISGAVAYHLWTNRDQEPPIGPMVTGFQRQNELTVFAAQVVSVPTSRIDGVINLLDREETAVLPAKVRYTVDLSGLDGKNVEWNSISRTVRLTVPPVLVQKPDIAEERARYFRRGPPASAATWDRLRRSNSIKGGREAMELARNPELVRMAEQNAREVIASNASLFLRGAGQDDVKVIIRFATEGRASAERWDTSRRPEEVLAKPR